MLTDREKNEHNPAEIILAWSNIWTYENLCIAHARHTDYILSDEHGWKTTDWVIKHLKLVG